MMVLVLKDFFAFIASPAIWGKPAYCRQNVTLIKSKARDLWSCFKCAEVLSRGKLQVCRFNYLKQTSHTDLQVCDFSVDTCRHNKSWHTCLSFPRHGGYPGTRNPSGRLDATYRVQEPRPRAALSFMPNNMARCFENSFLCYRTRLFPNHSKSTPNHGMFHNPFFSSHSVISLFTLFDHPPAVKGSRK